ncbi:MAG: methyltransferase [Candidatus Latescibacteria bacterium]|nr:methyltransferase [bacterium]MBD3425370.1 methyltransferase [Candidatus Latescibacterota bacterium]
MLLEYSLRIGAALVIGMIVGLEREFQGKPAGIRTNILMCVGSCLIMIISLKVAEQSEGYADPGRIAAQVITGVGFLCAGTIMRSRFSISGLTTAATIWVLSALGLASGAGYYLLAAVGTVAIVIVLILIRYLESYIISRRTTVKIHVEMKKSSMAPSMVNDIIHKRDIPREDLKYQSEEEKLITIFEYTASKKELDKVLKQLSSIDGVISVYST